MKKIYLGFCFSIFVFVAIGQSKIDVLHYKFEIELNDKNDQVSGKTYIQFVSLHSSSTFTIDLATVGDNKKGMTVHKIWLTNDTLKNLKFNHLNSKLTISNSAPLQKGDTSTLFITYSGIPSDGLIISKNKFGKRTFFADNWPNRAHHWIPCVDDPADKASVEFIVTAPDHYKVISNGILVEEKNIPGNKKQTHYKEEVPLPTKVMVIGAADFAVEKAGEVNNVPVYSWVFAENKEKGFYDYAQAVEILSFFTDYIAPFPYKKLANVQSKTIFGGMENAGAIFYHESSVTGERLEESLLAHEIAHQWFGDMATEKNFPHLWLSEGFATYLTHIYMEHKYGTDKLEKGIEEDRNQIIDFAKMKQLPVVDTVSPLMSLLNPNSYQKGSWVLHMLRRQLGDPVFHQIIRTYYETYKGKNADTEDFRAVAEKVSGKNLETFFHQWLYNPGIPQLDMNWKYTEAEKKISLTVKQTQKNVLFEFPLQIWVQQTLSSDPLFITMMIGKNTETIDLPVSGKPARVIADPLTSLLFEGTLKEIKN